MATYEEAISPTVRGQMTKDVTVGAPERQRCLNAQPAWVCNTRLRGVIGKTGDPDIGGETV